MFLMKTAEKEGKTEIVWNLFVLLLKPKQNPRWVAVI